MNPNTVGQSSNEKIEGVVSLMLTPFNPDGGIDWGAYAHYTEWQAAKHPSGLFAVCGSSEMKWLTSQERIALVKETVKYAGDVPVVATANLEPDISQHADEIKRVVDAGASAVVLVPPPLVSADVNRYRDYLVSISEKAPCPILVYEWPQVDNYLMDAELFASLAENQVITGIKDTTCTIEGIASKQSVAHDVTIFQANTPYLIDALDSGVRGIMAITSTAHAELVLAFWDAYQNCSDIVHDLHRELIFMDMLLRLAYPATAKYMLKLQGQDFSTYTRWDVKLVPEACKAIDVWHQHLAEKSSRI